MPEQSDIQLDDDQTFVENSREALNTLEGIRLKKLAQYKFRKSIGIPVAALLIPFLGYADYWLLMISARSDGDDGFAGLTFLVLGGIYWWITQPRRKYAKAYKTEILPSIAKLFGNMTYNIKGCLPLDILKSSKIIPSHDKVKSEDHFSGTYKDVNIEFCEMKMTETRGSGKNRRTVTTFKGLGILMDMKGKRFYGHTIVDRNRGKLSEWFKQKQHKLKRANLVDPRFEDIFDVYTNDQVEARYLVDPFIMERLVDLHDTFTKMHKPTHDQKQMDEVFMKHLRHLNGNYRQKWLTAAFWDSKVLILIANDYNHFEPADLHIPATDTQSILNMKREVADVLNMVDQMKAYDPLSVHRRSEAESEDSDPIAV